VSDNHGQVGGARAIPQRVVESVRTALDGVIDKVFAEPFDVRTAAELEQLVVAGPHGTGADGPPTGMGAFVLAATPIVQRTLRTAAKSGKLAGKVPLPSARAVRITAATIPVAMRVSHTSRRGYREIQLLASYVIAKLREAGVQPERGLVRSLTMSLYVEPARRPRVDVPPARYAGAVSRQWALRSLGGDSEDALRARTRKWVDAIDRLDLPAVAAEWRRGDVIDV
jgi:hypothetical protein